MFEQAGRALWHSGDSTAAEDRLRHAIELCDRSGEASGASAAVTLCVVLVPAGRLEEAKTLLDELHA